jgi:predicted nucleic acid-binding protein
MSDRWAYLDSSALAKLVVPEPETEALRQYLRRRPQRASSGLARTEVVRALRRHGPEHVAAARRLFGHLLLLRLTPGLLDRASELDPPELRSLDAIHVAAAESLGAELGTLLTYDERLADCARALGLPVANPS